MNEIKDVLQREYPLKATRLTEGRYDDLEEADSILKPQPTKKSEKALARVLKTSAKKVKEDFEKGQAELFSSEGLTNISSEDLRDLASRFKKLGRAVGDKYSSLIAREVEAKLKDLYSKKNIDVEAQIWASGSDSEEDMITDSDDYMQFATEIASSFIEGMGESWFYLLVLGSGE